MRRRSNTIHADSVADYISAAQSAYSDRVPFRKPAPRSPMKLFDQGKHFEDPSSHDQEESNSAKKTFSKTKEAYVEDADSFWSDFDFDSDQTTMKAAAMPSLTLSDNTVDTDCSEDIEGRGFRRAKTSLLRRIMIIGMNGSGKHSFINSVFECGENVSDRKSQMIDLLTKTEESEEDGGQVRYQFWIQNLYDNEERTNKLKELIKVYYKNVSLFVFMYSVEDKKSFECLESAIQSVLEEVPSEKFEGIILGNKGDLEETRKVSPLEGISLQNKYKLSLFEETHHQDKFLKERLVHLLRENEGDFRAKRGYSILSTDC